MMMKKLTLGKQERLKSRKLIDQVFKEGKSFGLFPYRVYYLFPEAKALKQPIDLLQFGVGVSTRNFKHATDRNRIKRLTREAWRLQKTPLRELVQLKGIPFTVFIIYTGKELPPFETANEKIAVILTRLLKTVHEIPAQVT
jgi:ribonuclease P protein component